MPVCIYVYLCYRIAGKNAGKKPFELISIVGIAALNITPHALFTYQPMQRGY